MYNEDYKSKVLLTNLFVLVAIKIRQENSQNRPGKTAPRKT